MIIGNIQFVVKISFFIEGEKLLIMKSAKCLETGEIYNKEQANRFYRNMR